MLRAVVLKNGTRQLLAPFTRSLATSSCVFAKSSPSKVNYPRPTSRSTSRPAKPSERSTDGRLDSYQLTSQLLRLTSHSRYSEALTLLHTSPPYAATTVVWNVLLNAILQNNNAEGTGAIKRGYEVWMDMKKRGVKPSSRSFGTFLGGAAKVARKLESRGVKKGDDAVMKEMLGNEVRTKVETVYKQWLVYQAKVQEGDQRKVAANLEAAEANDGAETSEDLSIHPTNQYLSFLSSSLFLSPDPTQAASTLSQILTTFESIPPPLSATPVSRNAVTYALILNALRTSLHLAISPTTPPNFPTTQSLLETSLAVFKPLLTTTPLPSSDPLRPQLATMFLSLFLLPDSTTVSQTTQSSILSLLPILHGILPPADLAILTPSPTSSDIILPVTSPALDTGALQCALKLLIKWEKLDWVEGTWEQVNVYPERYFSSGKNEVEIEHAEIVLEAMGKRGDLDSMEALLARLLLEPAQSALRLRLQTMETALESCFRSGKIESAWRVYRLFAPVTSSSPLPPSTASSSSTASTSSLTPKAPFPPSYKATTSFLLTAFNTRDKTKIWSVIKYLSSSDENGGGPYTSLFGPSAFPPSNDLSSGSSVKSATSNLSKKELVINKIQQKRDLKFQVRYGQALVSSLGRILSGREILSDEKVKRNLENWEARVKEWVEGRVSERVVGSDKGEMELRRERVKVKEVARGGRGAERAGVGRLSQEEIEGNSDADVAKVTDYDKSPMEEEEPKAKVGRKERRMGWYKDREGNSGKEERAIYESRQKQFERRPGRREGRPSSQLYREERGERSREREIRRFRGGDERERRGDRGFERTRTHDSTPRHEGGYRSSQRTDGGHREERGRSRQASWESN